MNCRALLIGVSLFLSSLAAAAQTLITFTGQSTFVAEGTPYGTVGETFSGSAVFDYDLNKLSTGTYPAAGPNYLSYQGDGAPFEFSVHIGSTVLTTPYIGFEVYDDGSQALSPEFATDTVTFSTKRQNVLYVLALSGPNSSFVGTGIPSPTVLQNFWETGIFSVYDDTKYPFADRQVFRGDISSVALSQISSPVPEPERWALMLLGGGLLAASHFKPHRKNR